MATRQCPDCDAPVVLANRGDGKCAACHGSGRAGTIADDVAGGKRGCSKCGGTGRCPNCRGQGVVTAAQVSGRPHATAELNPFDDKEAIKVRCPGCGEIDWFEWRFLGKLKDGTCGHEWYAETGLYAGKQIRASFQLGGKLVRYFNHGVSGEGAMIAKAMSYLFVLPLGICFRLPFSLAMIPIQAIVASKHRKKMDAQGTAKSSAAGS